MHFASISLKQWPDSVNQRILKKGEQEGKQSHCRDVIKKPSILPRYLALIKGKNAKANGGEQAEIFCIHHEEGHNA